MGFWIFMLLMALLIPVLMIILGAWMAKGGPKNINWFMGYRTFMSTRNMDTWRFAHMFFGRLWFRTGMILLPLTVGAMLFALVIDNASVETFGGVTVSIQAVFMFVPIIFTEIALKRNFDRYGNRK